MAVQLIFLASCLMLKKIYFTRQKHRGTISTSGRGLNGEQNPVRGGRE